MQNGYINHDGHSSGSGCSDLSALENETDTLGRAIIRHERDARRLQAVLNGTSRPFSRALPRPKASERFQRLSPVERQEAQAKHELHITQQVKEVAPVHGSARSWGRKQRPERRWTRYDDEEPREKLAETRTDARTVFEDEEDDAIVPHRTAFTGDDRDRQLLSPVGEDTPPSMKRYRPNSEPSSLRHMNSTVLDQAVDMSPARSILTTRPPPRTRVISEPESARARSSRRTINLRHDHEDDKENVPEAKLALPSQSQKLDLRSEALARPAHARNDSLQLLQRLAKVTSNSPVPRKSDQASQFRGEAAPSAGIRSTTRGQPSIEQDLPATPVVTGGWVDTPKQDSKTLSSADQEGSSQPVSVQTISQPGESSQSRTAQASKIQQQDAATNFDARPSKHTPTVKQESQSSAASSPRSALARRSPREAQPLDVKPVKRVAFDINGRTVCQHCGGGYNNLWEALWTELRSNFYVHDPSAAGGLRLTWLGAVALAWMCWFLLENLLCTAFCKPSYALHMHQFGLYGSAPTYPLVIPGLLLRPLRPAWQPLVEWLIWMSDLTFNWIFGEGSTGYTAPAALTRLATASSALENSALPASKTTVGGRWTDSMSTLASLSSGRAVASAVDAIDDMARLWDAGGWQ